jgi:hypothetical protein
MLLEDLYEQLLTIHAVAFENGLPQVGYYALLGALVIAGQMADKQRLRRIAHLAAHCRDSLPEQVYQQCSPCFQDGTTIRTGLYGQLSNLAVQKIEVLKVRQGVTARDRTLRESGHF